VTHQAADDLLRHPLSGFCGDMTEDEFTALAKDIEANGQQEPIVIYQGRVLDGWHRYRVCQMLAIPCQAEDWSCDQKDLSSYVISKNLNRRSLTPSQRAAAIVAIEGWVAIGSPVPKRAESARFSATAEGDDWEDDSNWSALESGEEIPQMKFNKSTKYMAAEAGVSPRTMARAKDAARQGQLPDVIAGKISLTALDPNGRRKNRSPRPVNPPMVQPVEHVDAEKAQLKAEIEELKGIVADLVDELQAIGTVKAEEDEQKNQIKALHATIRMLENTRDQLYDDKNALNHQIKGLTSKLRRAGL